MTMSEVLEGIRGLGERFDRHAKRLAALERETGMVDSDDPDPDDDNEKEPKDPTILIPRWTTTTTRIEAGPPGTPGQMTRAEMHRAAKAKDKLARSGKYGNIGINPNPGPSRNKHGRFGYERRKHVAAPLLTGGSFKDGHRELEYLEERNISFGRDGTVIPWDFLASTGRHAEKIERNLGTAKAWAPKVIEGRNVQTKFDRMGPDGHVRAITTSGASGAVGVDLDISRSQMWLAEVSPILGLMNVAMGINSELQVWYGGTAITGSAVAEGGAHTENDPTVTRLRSAPRSYSICPGPLQALSMLLTPLGSAPFSRPPRRS